MRAPLSWLRDFVPLGDDVGDLAATLDDLGLVVERLEHVGEGLDDILVARVLEISAIEGADRIRKVTVDAGAEPVEVVCGAWNFAVGDLVPLAPVGATLAGDFEIRRRKMKGVTSNGMICSGRELGLSDDHEGILILGEVEGAEVGKRLVDALGIERDVVFDLTVEGDRPDAWSIAGVARNLAARLGLPFALPEPPSPRTTEQSVDTLASVTVDDRDLSPRFTARLLQGVKVGPSPRLIARRLTLSGMRPINNVVDVSNYVMLELGQPTHPYDWGRLGGRGLRVRRARAGETVVTLDGVERRLGIPGPGLGDDGRDCVICDADDVPVGIGGIMGGASSEIDEGTTSVLLEAAYFDPLAITRTATRLSLRTEASVRFERGTDPLGIDRSVDRICQLLDEQGALGGVAQGVLDVRGDVPTPRLLELGTRDVNRLLGTDLTDDAIRSLLEPLGFAVAPKGSPGSGTAQVLVPTSRPDVRPAPFGSADLIEEVARMYGYRRIPRRQPAWPQPGRLSSRQRDRRRIREAMVGLGALEAWTSSLVSPSSHERIGLVGPEVELANPQQSDETVLRRSLMPGLLGALVRNADRREGDVRLFEVGVVFAHPDDPSAALADRRGDSSAGARDVPYEREMGALALSLPGDDARTAVAAWQVVSDEFRLEHVHLVPSAADLLGEGALAAAPGLHPTRSAWLVAGSTILGAVGEIDPSVLEAVGRGKGGDHEGRRVGWLELDLDRLFDPDVVARRPDLARPVSRHPSSDMDLALVVDDSVSAERVAATLRRAGGELLERVGLFDVFRSPALGPGRRSLAFRLRFSSLDHTLTEEELTTLRLACIEAAGRELGAELRS